MNTVPEGLPITDTQCASWSKDVRELLNDLAAFEFKEQASPLQKLCVVGSEYGLRTLERTVSSEGISLLGSRAKRHIKDYLRQILARATGPCFALELKAFRGAYEAIYSHESFPDPELMEDKFLGEQPYDRLISLFKKFPVLAELWSQLICQWRDSVWELLVRVKEDQQRISRAFFRRQPIGKIIDLRAGLSDPHNKGRTVMRIEFEAGPIIYKPRSGKGEQEWFNFISYLNAASFRPKLTAARVFCRDGYCWMHEVKFAPCKDQASARRFYKRLGGMIAAAYLLKTVDCHRDNLIAFGEYPVLVDAETLWHPLGTNETTTPLDELAATGFLPSSRRRLSYQYRSSAVGSAPPGKHTPHLAATPLRATQYEIEIVAGFRRAWQCLLGTNARHAAFARRVQRLRGEERRRIYRSTGAYDAITRASIQPASMRSGASRNLLIAQLCNRNAAAQSVIGEETDALMRLDIPYFVDRPIGGLRFPEHNAAPVEITDALRCAVRL